MGEKGEEASEDGVLGGYGHVNDPDIKSSEAFLNTLLSDQFTDEKRNRHLVVLGNKWLLLLYLCVFTYNVYLFNWSIRTI